MVLYHFEVTSKLNNRLHKQNYARPRPTREPNELYLIICEGSDTEVAYFKSMRKYVRNPAITIRILGGDKVSSDPYQMVEAAKTHTESEHIWCVFDDDQRSNIKQVLSLARSYKFINTAFSNPCFELWYLLHYVYSTAQMLPKEVLERLNSRIPKYSKTSDYFEMLLPYYNDAYDRACKLAKHHEDIGNCPDDNPSTSVYILADELMNMKK